MRLLLGFQGNLGGCNFFLVQNIEKNCIFTVIKFWHFSDDFEVFGCCSLTGNLVIYFCTFRVWSVIKGPFTRYVFYQKTHVVFSTIAWRMCFYTDSWGPFTAATEDAGVAQPPTMVHWHCLYVRWDASWMPADVTWDVAVRPPRPLLCDLRDPTAGVNGPLAIWVHTTLACTRLSIKDVLCKQASMLMMYVNEF